MSHIISGRLDSDTAPADAAEKYEDVLEAFQPILDDEDFDEIPARWDGEVPAYVEFSARFDHRDGVDAIVAELEDAFGGVEWLAIHTRTDDAEATVAEYRDDPEYFDPNLEYGVRAPVAISRTGRFEVDVGPAYVVIDGDEIDAKSDSIDVERPESGWETTGVYVSADGSIGTSGDLRIATIEIHPGKIVEIKPMVFELPTSIMNNFVCGLYHGPTQLFTGRSIPPQALIKVTLTLHLMENEVQNIGTYDGKVTTFAPSDHSSNLGVHTLSITPHPKKDKYLAYAGPVHKGTFEIWESSNLKTWSKYPTRSSINIPGVRWPSAITVNNTVWIAYRSKFGGRPERFHRIKRILNGYGFYDKSQIHLMHSENGTDFNYYSPLVTSKHTGNKTNQNPFLFIDPQAQKTHLIYFSKYTDSTSKKFSKDKYEIRLRTAKKVTGLSDGNDKLLFSSDQLIAAPSVFFHPTQEQYYVFVETFDEENSQWMTEYCCCECLTFMEGGKDNFKTLFADNEPCPFPYLKDEFLYLFTTKCQETIGKHEIDAKWEGRIHRWQL